MAAVTSLGILVDDVADFAGFRGVADPALLVKDADTNDAGLIADSAHDLVQAVAVVAHHVVGRTALDDVADALCGSQRRCLEMPAVQADVEIPEQSEDDHQGEGQKRNKFGAQAVAYAAPAPGVRV